MESGVAVTADKEENICPPGTETLLTMDELEAIAEGKTWAFLTVNSISNNVILEHF